MTEPETHDGWDVFISYAREDYRKARDLADDLQKCVTAKGVPPRIFLDVDRDGGTPVGVDWVHYLEKALRGSRYIVALYTPRYFSKGICLSELHEAVRLTDAKKAQLIPVLMDEAAQDSIAFTANRINWLPVTHPKWFDHLRDALDLRPAASGRRLRFETAVPDAVVNRTLPTVRVTVVGADGTPVPESGEPVALTVVPPDPGLNGTLVATTVRGAADFADLSFRVPVPSVRLVAEAPGCESAESPPIRVSPPPRPARAQPADQDREPPSIMTSGRPFFFSDAPALVVLDDDRLTVHGFERRSRGDGAVRLASPPRLWARGARRLAVADWTGRVVVATPDGHTRAVDLARAPGLAVPGALAFDGGTLLVGMWNGTVWSLAEDAEPEVLIEHPAGVQHLAVDGRGRWGEGGRLLVADLDGALTVYEGGRAGAKHSLERLLLGVHRGPGHTIIVGERHIYRLDDGASRPLVAELPVQPVADALIGPELSIALNDDGVGVSFDTELGVHLGFRTVPGARPVCATHDGRLVVFEYPDRSHVLMCDGRIGVTSAYPLAISQDGRTVATSDGHRIFILPTEELDTGAAKPEPSPELSPEPSMEETT
ncbi:TIR domain-containing protein [Actinomadura chibensis]|uniref:TIR domain-containing protein n=1 Tax=Actinomadura chibensis TaxID=392828 RepID=A0A5D0NHR2_9ACTN|nr:TIR domain-containing protein [Actinomadura chibensis]TYB43950.1 TIR domain-containing protein [Actinomadura chibensis]